MLSQLSVHLLKLMLQALASPNLLPLPPGRKNNPSVVGPPSRIWLLAATHRRHAAVVAGAPPPDEASFSLLPVLKLLGLAPICMWLANFAAAAIITAISSTRRCCICRLWRSA